MYRYDAARRQFEELQRLETLGTALCCHTCAATLRCRIAILYSRILCAAAVPLLCLCYASYAAAMPVPSLVRGLHQLTAPGAHDLEAMHEEGRLLLAVANQGDGISCDSGSVDLYAYDAATRRFAMRQRMRGGCATYVASYRQALALAPRTTGLSAWQARSTVST